MTCTVTNIVTEGDTGTTLKYFLFSFQWRGHEGGYVGGGGKCPALFAKTMLDSSLIFMRN